MIDAASPESEMLALTDDDVVQVLALAGRGWGLGDIAAAIGAHVVDVIDALHAHRDCFVPEYPI